MRPGQPAPRPSPINSMAALPPRAQWAFADEVLWEAISQQAPVPHGPRGHILRRFIGAADSCGAGSLAVRLVGLVETTRLLVRRRRAGYSGPSGDPIAMFVGFGARAEESLFDTHKAASAVPVVRVDQNRLPESGLAGVVCAREVWAAFSEAMRDVAKGCSTLASLQGRRADFLAAAARRVGNYAFARCWWRNVLLRHNVVEARFVAADVAAYAAVAENLEATYVQHGAFSRYIWFPRFASVFPLTSFDAGALRQRLPNALVHRSRMTPARPARRRPTVLIASGEYPATDMMRIAPLVRRLAAAGLEIRVRLYPGEAPDRFWSRAELGAAFVIDSEPGSFADALRRLEPAFVASWSSTVLIEALYAGILPISVASEDDPVVRRMAYGLLRCCLRWPEDDGALDEVRQDSAAYDRWVDRLRQVEGSVGQEAAAR